MSNVAGDVQIHQGKTQALPGGSSLEAWRQLDFASFLGLVESGLGMLWGLGLGFGLGFGVWFGFGVVFLMVWFGYG